MMTHRGLLINHYTAHKRLFLLSCTYFISFVILLSVLRIFFLVSEVPVTDVETQSANHKYHDSPALVQYFTLPNSLFYNKTAEQ